MSRTRPPEAGMAGVSSLVTYPAATPIAAGDFPGGSA